MSLIAIYDSGVGGLSVYQAIVDSCPAHEFIFVSDNEAFPYGTKAEPELIDRVTSVVNRINEHYAPDVLVVACNTASTVALPSLRARFDCQIVGVVPAIKPAAKLSKTKHIGLLATPATVQRAYTDSLISEFASDCRVTKIGSSELVELAEDKLNLGLTDTEAIAKIIEPIVSDQRIDVLVLACTHFPLLKDELRGILNAESRDVELVDSGAGIARRVNSLVSSGSNTGSEATAVFTQALNESNLFETLDGLAFSSIEVLTI